MPGGEYFTMLRLMKLMLYSTPCNTTVIVSRQLISLYLPVYYPFI